LNEPEQIDSQGPAAETGSAGSETATARVVTHSVPPPLHRPLKIFAFDPMRGRAPLNTLTLEVANESLLPGPQGARIRVVDYDGGNRQFYEPVDLNDPAILMQGGLEPTESDPRFHQQMVYAVAAKVLENFDKALGRRIVFKGNRRLTLLPHAFREANAFYDPRRWAINFGYFTADRRNPGENLPGQTVFTCLSHDIITHEVTHALVHRLRGYFLEPTNDDVFAFHEGFSDIVAIFQHFTFEAVLRDMIQRTHTNLRSPTELVKLASQFGYATGRGDALRSALDEDAPDPKLYENVSEPHERGSILVAAVFDAFFATYQRRIQDLLRIATGGTGRLPEGELHPDLVTRIAREASRAADSILTMCIRAFEYLPPVDIRFGDYLRALVTSDYDLVAEEGFDQRHAMIEAFRLRGIYPDYVPSLAEDSLLWERPDDRIGKIPQDGIPQIMQETARSFRRRSAELGTDGDGFLNRGDTNALIALGERRIIVKNLLSWAHKNAKYLDLDGEKKIRPLGFHSVFRVAPNGQLQVEVVAQFGQIERTVGNPDYGGLPVRGGTTVIAAADGTVRYVISKPLCSKKIRNEKQGEARVRVDRQRKFVETCDLADPALAWSGDAYLASRMNSHSFRALHQGLVA
jgi:hypothetical protein